MSYCIVVPVYKQKLDCTEELSLKRLHKIIYEDDRPFHTDDFRDWEERHVYLMCPKGMNTEAYKKIYPSIKVKEFDKKWFKSTDTYSQLLINYNFYKEFDEYEYMCIYQLDCYIFKDEIGKWCNKGWDYIGGPIISENAGWTEVMKNGVWKPAVGNGGFSIRKISTFKDITNPKGEFRQYYKITDELLKNVKFEDKYFCNDIIRFYDLEIPRWQEAYQFAIDMNADIFFNNFKVKDLPVGCHAWPKNIRYWKNVIKEITPDIVDFCENKYKDFFKLYYNEKNSTLREKDEDTALHNSKE